MSSANAVYWRRHYGRRAMWVSIGVLSTSALGPAFAEGTASQSDFSKPDQLTAVINRVSVLPFYGGSGSGAWVATSDSPICTDLQVEPNGSPSSEKQRYLYLTATATGRCAVKVTHAGDDQFASAAIVLPVDVKELPVVSTQASPKYESYYDVNQVAWIGRTVKYALDVTVNSKDVPTGLGIPHTVSVNNPKVCAIAEEPRADTRNPVDPKYGIVKAMAPGVCSVTIAWKAHIRNSSTTAYRISPGSATVTIMTVFSKARLKERPSIRKWGNKLPAGKGCGTFVVEVHNGSDIPIGRVAVVVGMDTDPGSAENVVPYRGSREASLVNFKTYLKPGRTKTVQRYLCASLDAVGWDRTGVPRFAVIDSFWFLHKPSN